MADKLATYQQKRDFAKTPEPSGGAAASGKAKGASKSRARSSSASKSAAETGGRATPTKSRRADDKYGTRVHTKAGTRARKLKPGSRFVVQQHDASSMHWDFRLEKDGVLVSWAVPKGLPPAPKKNNLAIHVEDHPLDYFDFEGEIPKGQYGGGSVELWDTGHYEIEKWEPKKIVVDLHGQRVDGRYALFQTRGNQWMIHRMSPPSDPGREPMPRAIKPMLATLGSIPADEDEYGYEIKWDGIRALVSIEGGRIDIESRNQNEITAQYPEFARLGRALGSHEVVLDAEIVAFDERGVPSFQLLQSRLGLKSESTIRTRAKVAPATLIVFDLLYLDGHSTMDLPYVERRELLESLDINGAHWQTPSYHRGEGQALLDAATRQGYEGVMAKRLDSTYCPGKRSRAWLKVKQQQRQEFVVGGWTWGEGARDNRIGALLLGYYDKPPSSTRGKKPTKDQQFVYAGSVGTGFTEATLADLQQRLAPLASDDSPFDVNSPGTRKPQGKWATMRARDKQQAAAVRKRGGGLINYVDPVLVGEVEFTEFTRDGTLRHPSWKGLRDDKLARDVVREDRVLEDAAVAKPRRTSAKTSTSTRATGTSTRKRKA